ncbi:ribokinase [Actinokineospora sp. NBRC 105648]|uniref:ribokinase n=1 Tax=Actinokineospora sp. NBRC 105648 TaxID=3032206 RepID=UPI0024A37D47|nr:ribokinase [Actinokineospora sp. NBRC 105648]GLZ37415.1 ribokinase [Actinokineospora sp. NBRC 105648]
MVGAVVVVGSANADLVVQVARRPGAGETVLGSDARVLPGGKGANTAVAAARTGAAVSFVGAVGQDGHGDLLLGSLSAAGLDVTRVRRVDRPTGIAHIAVTPDGENSIVVSPGANGALTPADVELGDARVLAVSLEVPVAVAEHAVALAERLGVRAVVNLSPVVELSAAALAVLDPVVVNEHEAALLGSSIEVCRSVVITMGGRGAVVVTSSGTAEIPAPEVEVVDTTGAGDAFVGALASALAAGDDLLAAARRAVEFASRTVTRPGAQSSYAW